MTIKCGDTIILVTVNKFRTNMEISEAKKDELGLRSVHQEIRNFTLDQIEEYMMTYGLDRDFIDMHCVPERELWEIV